MCGSLPASFYEAAGSIKNKYPTALTLPNRVAITEGFEPLLATNKQLLLKQLGQGAVRRVAAGAGAIGLMGALGYQGASLAQNAVQRAATAAAPLAAAGSSMLSNLGFASKAKPSVIRQLKIPTLSTPTMPLGKQGFDFGYKLATLYGSNSAGQPLTAANYMEVPGMISKIAQLAKAAAEKTAFSSGLGMLPKPPMPTSSRPTAGPGGSGGVGGIISGMLPKPTMPYAAGGPGGMASTGAGATQPKLNLQQAGQEVNQAMRNTIRSGRPGPSATAMQMAPQTPQPKPAAPAMNPSDQAKAMLADLNARRRAAGGEVSDAADIQSKANALLNQSNAMRNAAGYKPAAGGNLRDQADAIRQKLNAMRSAAGGEVPESAAMMREMNRLNAQYDSTSFPSSVSTQMLAKAAAEKTALAGLTGGSLGALTGLLTSEKGQRNRAVGRGAAIGAGTEIGIYPGALAGALAGGGLGLAHSPAAALGGLVAGGGLGAVGGGALGNMAARGLVGPYKNEKLDSGEGDEDEEAEEKEAACSKKTRYQKMRERRGEIDNLAADAAMVTRGEKSAFSFSGLFGSKPAAPKPAAPAVAPAPNAAKPNSLKAMGKDLGVYGARK
jgi:hypothetical protein